MYNERKDTFDFKSVILQFLFVALFIFILVWLFPLKSDLKKAVASASSNDSSVDLSLFYDRIFNENVVAMKDSAKSYFTTSRLPQNVGDKVKMTLGEMLNAKIILPFVDSKGKQCDLNDSYVEVTKNDDEFVMKVNLKCSNQENYLLVYMGCYDYCQTAICEKNTADVKTPVVYSGKTNKPIKQTATTTSTSNVYNKVINNVTNVVNNITNINNININQDIDINHNINVIINKKDPDPTPTPDPDPTPDPTPTPSKEYIYEYKKTKSTTGTCTYTDWSEEQTTPITATPTLEVKVRTVKVNTLVGYNVTTANDITKPIYGTKEVGIGYETKKYCKKYGYVNTGSIAYNDWQYVGYVTLRYAPTNTDTTKYIPVTDTNWLCLSQCQAGTDGVYKMYTRSATNSVAYQCTEYGEAKTLITANQTVVTGYEKKEVSRVPVYQEKTVKYYSSRTKNCTAGSNKTSIVWSVYNDRSLLDNGYTYTGNKKQK